jgi:hypothetical protein
MMQTTSLYYTACSFCEKVRDAFKSIFLLIAEAQMRRAAFWQARHLIETNKDFANHSTGELTQRILEDMQGK